VVLLSWAGGSDFLLGMVQGSNCAIVLGSPILTGCVLVPIDSALCSARSDVDHPGLSRSLLLGGELG